MTYPRNSLTHKMYTLFLRFTIYRFQVIVHNITIRIYINRKKSSWSHLTYKRWSKTSCMVRGMVQKLRGSLHVPPKVQEVLSLAS